MTSLVIEHFDAPASTREAMALGAAGERAGDVLAGRTVWCAMTLPRARRSADVLRDRMEGAGPDVAAASLEVDADEQLLGLSPTAGSTRLSESDSGGLGPAERDAYARGALGGEERIGQSVSAQDVVVVHDLLSALATQAIRERGAHAVWRLPVAEAPRVGAGALELLRRLTPGIDAYVTTWLQRGSRGEVVECVAAVMPSAGIVATKEFPIRFAGDEPRRLAWRMAIAEIVRSDRLESVGGTLRPRPSVAPR